MALRAGQLNRRVTIQQETKTADGGGGHTKAWGDLATAWARVVRISGVDGYQAQQVQGTAVWEVEVRYRTDVTTAMRVKYGTRYLYIAEPPFSPDERRESLMLICEERQA